MARLQHFEEAGDVADRLAAVAAGVPEDGVLGVPRVKGLYRCRRSVLTLTGLRGFGDLTERLKKSQPISTTMGKITL